MKWKTLYQPPSDDWWQGRSDAPKNSSFFQIVRLINLLDTQTHNETNAFALLGFCCDEGVKRNFGRTGAAEGPKALRDALSKFPVHQNNMIFFDAGNIVCSDGDLENAQCALGEVISQLLSMQITPIVIGGGHEVAWGHYQGIAKNCADTKIGIINFDAHFDMRPLIDNQYGSSGTPFLQIAHACEKQDKKFNYTCIGIQKTGNHYELFQTAKKYGVQIISADELHMNNPEIFFHFIDKIIARCEKIYLSICLDVFSAAYAPGVSAVQPLGLSPQQFLPLFKHLINSKKIISFDIAELNPKFDFNQQTAKLAACLVHEIIHQ